MKVSDMLKHLPALSSRIIKPLQCAEKSIPPESMDRMVAASSGPKGILSSLGSLGIVLSPDEFQRCTLGGSGLEESEWPWMDRSSILSGFQEAPQGGCCVGTDAVRPEVLREGLEHLKERSILTPHLVRRVHEHLDTKSTSGSTTSPVDPEGSKCLRRPAGKITIQVDMRLPKELGTLYGRYLRDMSTKLAALISHFLKSYPKFNKEMYGASPTDLTKTSGRGSLQDLHAQALLPALYLMHKTSYGDQLPRATALQILDQLSIDATSFPLLGGVVRTTSGVHAA